MLPSPLPQRRLPPLFGVIDVELPAVAKVLGNDEHGVIFMAQDDVSRLLGGGNESELLARTTQRTTMPLRRSVIV